LVFGSIWAILHASKVAWLSVSNDAIPYLVLINRQTGIHRWGNFGLILSVVGLFYAAFLNYLYVPMFIALIIGFGVARYFANGEKWPIEPRQKKPTAPLPGSDEKPEPGDIVREFFWKLDSPLRDLKLSTEVFFKTEEIEEIRKKNPFWENPDEASRNGRLISRRLVLTGVQQRQVIKVTQYIQNLSAQKQLTRFEEMQAALDFVQNDNINYILDEECPEIRNSKEYFRFPAETMFDKRGDCDCKTILAAALLTNMGYPVLLIFSNEAGHAALAVGGAPGLVEELPDVLYVQHNGQIYYFCETTGEGWTIGQKTPEAEKMIARESNFIDLQ
jgi:hypothetical protein